MLFIVIVFVLFFNSFIYSSFDICDKILSHKLTLSKCKINLLLKENFAPQRLHDIFLFDNLL